MRIPQHILKHPDWKLVSEYYSEEEAVKIIASGIPINRPGVVPSLQVPPGKNPDCYGATGLGGLGDFEPVGGWDASSPVWDSYSPLPYGDELPYGDDIMVISPLPLRQISPELANYGFLQTVIKPDAAAGLPLPSSRAPNQVLAGDEPDFALGWVEDNWMMIAAGLGAVILVSTMGGRRRR